MIDIQGLFFFNPKTREYLVRIGNYLFPFKSSEEVVAYFLGKSKIIRTLKEAQNKPKTSTNNIISLFNRYVSTYLRTYLRLSTLTKTKTHQNTPNQNLHSLKIFLCGVLIE